MALQRKKNEASYKAALAGGEWTNTVQIVDNEASQLELCRCTRVLNAYRDTLMLQSRLVPLHLSFVLIVDRLPEKRVLAVTIPEEFDFKTNNQSKGTTSSNTSQKEFDFVLQLRKPTTSVSSGKLDLLPIILKPQRLPLENIPTSKTSWEH